MLINEYLSRSLNALYVAKPLLYYKVPKGIPLSHLAFADDCIIFCNGCKENILILKKCLECFEKQTGQKINLQKSGFLPRKRANVPMLSELLDIPLMTFPFIYLGAPIAKGKCKKILFSPLLDKIRTRFQGWNLNLIS